MNFNTVVRLVFVTVSIVTIIIISFLASIVPANTLLPYPTAGCGNQAVGTVRTVRQAIRVGNDTRFYLLHVPTDYETNTPIPVVFSLHGYGGSGGNHFNVSGWEATSDANTFIAVAPEGGYIPQRWNSGSRALLTISDLDDVRFFRAMVEELQANFCIDQARVYAAGFSNGGGMVNRLACEMSDTFAAIGIVAGAVPTTDECANSRPVPIIAFHGTADTIANFEGDPPLDLVSYEGSMSRWAARNECDLVPLEFLTNADVRGYQYPNCGGEVVYYVVDGGGHTWPGSPVNLILLGRTTQTISATQEIWNFFQRHALEQIYRDD